MDDVQLLHALIKHRAPLRELAPIVRRQTTLEQKMTMYTILDKANDEGALSFMGNPRALVCELLRELLLDIDRLNRATL